MRVKIPPLTLIVTLIFTIATTLTTTPKGQNYHGHNHDDSLPGSDPVGRNIAIACSIVMSLTVMTTTVTAINCCVKKKSFCFKEKLCCFKKENEPTVNPSTPAEDTTTTEMTTFTSTTVVEISDIPVSEII